MLNTRNVIIAAIIIFLLFYRKRISNMWNVMQNWIVKEEGFSPKPYWDYKQWSWGYGTAAGFDKAKKPEGTISREKAWIDAAKRINNDMTTLKKALKMELNANQWVALLSFAYNAGIGAALKIVKTMNDGRWAYLPTHWSSYNKVTEASGKKVISPVLVSRRKRELELFNKKDV